MIQTYRTTTRLQQAALHYYDWTTTEATYSELTSRSDPQLWILLLGVYPAVNRIADAVTKGTFEGINFCGFCRLCAPVK